jgi:hypothetical protein
VLHVPFVEAEGEFINVAAKMLFAGVMVDANQPALHDRENALRAVRGHAVADELAFTVIDRFVFKEHTADSCICSGLVGMQDRSDFHMPMNFGLDGSRVRVRNRRCDGPAASLAHPKNRGLADSAAAGLEFLMFVLVGLDTADECFINFDDPAKLLDVWTTGFPDAMQHEPSRCLPDSNLFRQLQTRDALAGREKQIHRIEPLVQGNVASLEYRAGSHREIFLALIAAVKAALPRRDPLAKAAYRALRTIRPKVLFQIGPRRLLIWEHREKFERRNGGFAHEPISHKTGRESNV